MGLKNCPTQRCSPLPFTLHTRYNCTILNFKVGHFARHFLFFSFGGCYERNSIHTALLSYFISRLPQFTTCFILSSRVQLLNSRKVNDSTPLVVSLNDESQLAHQRQQSAGSTFSFSTHLLKCLLLSLENIFLY